MTCKSFRVYFVCIHAFLSLAFYRQPSTPPPTPSPVKPAAGKKRAIGTYESDGDDIFVPRYFFFNSPQRWTCWRPPYFSPTRDSPKKPRAKQPSTPSKASKGCQLIFDTAVSAYVFSLIADSMYLTWHLLGPKLPRKIRARCLRPREKRTRCLHQRAIKANRLQSLQLRLYHHEFPFSVYCSLLLNMNLILVGKDTVHLADVEMYRVTYVCFWYCIQAVNFEITQYTGGFKEM